MSPSSSWSRTVVLMSSDGETFEIYEAEAQPLLAIKNLIKPDCNKTCISIADVTRNTLAMIINYCRMHAEFADNDDLLTSFDRMFLDGDDATLHDLKDAILFLNIRSLIPLINQALANRKIKANSKEYICDTERFKIKSNISQEEEPEVRRENTWHFDKSKTPSTLRKRRTTVKPDFE